MQANPNDAETARLRRDCALIWRLERSPGRLSLSYAVANGGTSPVWLLDRLLYWPPGRGIALGPERVSVHVPATGAPLRLVRGFVAPLGFPLALLPPTARELLPGETVEGRACVDLPLRTWNPNEPVARAIEPMPERAVLEIGVLLGPPSEIRVLADATEVAVPSLAELREQRLLTGEILPVPSV